MTRHLLDEAEEAVTRHLLVRIASIAIGMGFAYGVILLGRAHGMDPEARGVWAGAVGVFATEIFEKIVPIQKP